ncbi:MAG: S-layer homology domain-containing protein, partial [Firmicutes bacterium]|nr:S-layer homology domain-containing protein [Bacillota bacterium]
ELIGAENDIILADAVRFHVPLANANGALAGRQSTDIIPDNVHPTVAGQEALAAVGEAALTRSPSLTETKGTFVFELLSLLGYKPDPAGKSPYVDVPTRSFLWGYVHSAILLGIVQPESATRFGVDQPVTEAQAAVMAARLARAGGAEQGFAATTEAAEWALHADLFGAFASSRPMTLAEELGFAARLKALLAQAPPSVLPPSWKLSSAQAAAFTQALAVSDQSQYLQIRGADQLGMKLVSPNSTLGKLLDQTDAAAWQHPLAEIPFTDRSQDIAGKLRNYAVLGPITGSDASPTTIREFSNGSTIYVNSGSGWAIAPPLQSQNQLLDILSSLSQPAFGYASLLRDVTGRSISGGYVFSGRVDLAAAASVLSSVQDLLPQFAVKGMSRTALAALVDRSLKQAQGTLSVTVLRIAGEYRFTDETMRLSVPFPMSLIRIDGHAAPASSLSHIASGVDLTQKLALTLSYDIVPVSVPAAVASQS